MKTQTFYREDAKEGKTEGNLKIHHEGAKSRRATKKEEEFFDRINRIYKMVQVNQADHAVRI